MAQPKVIRPRPQDGSRPVHLSTRTAETSLGDKKICPGRRQQRHSTEIGSAYHRWWVVRNVLGFETNEHIAGLLLDGFHSTLEQLVSMTGGQVFDPEIHGLEKMDSDMTSSTSPHATNPPGFIEDMDEFIHYKSTIGYYCEYLWTLCIQENRMQPVLHSLSPPIQQFLIRLIGYLRSAKAKSQTPSSRRRRSRSSSSKQADSLDTKLQSQPPKTEYLTSPPRNGEATQSTYNVNSKAGTYNHTESLNSDYSLTHGPTTEDHNVLQQNNKQAQQPSSDNRNVGLNFPCNTELKSEGRKSDEDFEISSSKYWDTSSSHNAFVKRNSDQFEPWTSQRAEHSRAKRQGDNQVDSINENQGTRQRWTHKIYDNRDDKNYRSSLEQEDKGPDWTRTENIRVGDTMQGTTPASAPNSCPSSVASTPRVYLDRDVDQSMEEENSEGPASEADDLCLKLLLSRPLKVQHGGRHQFVKEDVTEWQGFQHARKNSHKERYSAWTPDLVEKKSPNDRKVQNSQQFSEKTHLSPKDLSYRPDMRNSGSKTRPSQTSTASSSNYLGSVSGDMSSAPPTLVYSGSTNGQQHPLGTPVFLYPAGRFPAADNSLASLPALVQNIVYNQSGTPLLQPIAEHPCTQAPTNSFSPAATIVNRGPGTDPSGPRGFLPLYMHGSSRVDPGYSRSSHVVSNSSGTLPGHMSVLSSTSKRSSSSDLQTDLVRDLPSTTKLYQEWTTASGYQLLSSLGSKAGVSNRSPQFQITDVRSCEDTDFTSSGSQSGFTSIPTQGVWPHDNKPHRHEDTTVSSDVQGLSGRKLNIVTDLRDLRLSRGGNQQAQLSFRSYRKTGTQAYHRNNNRQTSTGHSSGRHTFHSQRDSKATAFSHSNSHYTSTDHNSTGKSYHQASPKVLTKHIVSSMDSSTRAKSSQTAPPPKPSSFIKKRQNSSTDVEDLSDTSLKEESRLRSSVGQTKDNSKLLDRDQQSEEGNRPKGNPVIPQSDLGTKKSGQVSKPRTSATSGHRSSSRRHTCVTCELVFPSGTDLLLHRYEQHSLVCGECDSRFLSSSGLLRHKETDHPPISRCQHCRFLTYSREELASHIQSEHGTVSSDDQVKPEVSSEEASMSDTPSGPCSGGNQAKKKESKTDPPPAPISPDSCQDDLVCLPQPPLPRVSKQEKIGPVHSKLSTGTNGSSRRQRHSSSSERDKSTSGERMSDKETINSELEESSLVIETGEWVKSSQEEQPLCLVVHTRENERKDQPSPADEQDLQPEPKEQICRTDRLTDNERGREQTLDKPVPSRDQDEEAVMTSQSGMESLQSFHKGKEIRTPAKRRIPTTAERRFVEVDPASAACFNFRENSLESVDRDDWSTGQLDGSGDGQTINKIDLIAGASRRRSTDQHSCDPTKHPHQSKRAKSISTEDVSSLPANSVVEPTSSGEVTLQDRHTLSSLPPKKRGFRKSPRHSSANSSVGTRTLRGGNGQEKAADVCQPKQDPSENSNVESKTEVEENQNGPSTMELGQNGKKDTTVSASSPMPSLSVSKTSKVLKKKQKLSRTSKKLGQSRHKHCGSEVSGLRNKLRNKIDEAQPSQTSSISPKEPIRSFKCPTPGCNASFSRKSTMKVHVKGVHRKDGNQLPCHVPSCSAKFSSRRDLRRHVMEGHHGKVRRHVCRWPECKQSFFSHTHLRTHNLVHTGEKPITCQFCDYRCRQRTALTWHMRKHANSSGDKQEYTKNSSTDSKSADI